MITIGLSGPQYSGKSAIAQYLAERHGAWVWAGSQLLRRVLEQQQRMPQPRVRGDYNELSAALRGELGPEFMFQAFVRARAKEAGQAPIAVHDGIRWVGAAHTHRTEPGFRLIWLCAPVRKRFQRALALPQGKGGRAAINEFTAFMQDEYLPSELELPQVEALADVCLWNDEPLEATRLRIDALVDKWTSIRT